MQSDYYLVCSLLAMAGIEDCGDFSAESISNRQLDSQVSRQRDESGRLVGSWKIAKKM